MARSNALKIIRTTRANLNTQAAASGLLQGELYLITDEARLAVATLTSAYVTCIMTGTLPVSSGGTGVTTSTGTGNTVLSASPTFTGTAGFAAISATGAVSATSFAVTSGGTLGGIRLVQGTDGGYMEFQDEAATRHGYLGYPLASAAGPAGTGPRLAVVAESPMIGYSITGDLLVSSGANALHYRVGNVQVLGARITGWAAPTGTATRSTFVTSTVTLQVLAEHVKALIDDWMTHGGIGT